MVLSWEDTNASLWYGCVSVGQQRLTSLFVTPDGDVYPFVLASVYDSVALANGMPPGGRLEQQWAFVLGLVRFALPPVEGIIVDAVRGDSRFLADAAVFISGAPPLTLNKCQIRDYLYDYRGRNSG